MEPEIKFKVNKVWKLDLTSPMYSMLYSDLSYAQKVQSMHVDYTNNIITPEDFCRKLGVLFAESDLGIKNVTFEQLRDELLRLNKKATIETPFYVNLLEPIPHSKL